MRLEYRILWFEDNEAAFRAEAGRFETHLKQLGFRLNARCVSEAISEDDDLSELTSFDADLILVDWKLRGENGEVVASMIRRLFPYTDIIFYSSYPGKDLRRLVAEQGIDGVYCMGRNDLKSSGIRILEMTVRKAVDINHMRGIVMATVAEFEAKVDECLCALYERLTDERGVQFYDELVSKYSTRLVEDVGKYVKTLESNPPLEAVLGHRLFDSRKKIDRLLKSIKVYCGEEPALQKLRDVLMPFASEVLEARNCLAHASEVVDEDSGVRGLRGKAKKGGVEVRTMTSEDMDELRTLLLRYENRFARLLKLLRS